MKGVKGPVALLMVLTGGKFASDVVRRRANTGTTNGLRKCTGCCAIIISSPQQPSLVEALQWTLSLNLNSLCPILS